MEQYNIIKNKKGVYSFLEKYRNVAEYIFFNPTGPKLH